MGYRDFTGPELAVAVQKNIAITIIFCNNRAYGSIRSEQDRFYDGRRFGVDLYPLNRRLRAFQTALKEAVPANEFRMIESTLDLIDP